MEYLVGLNVLNNYLQKGLKYSQCNILDSVAYNVNLDYVCDLINEYDVTVNIYSNLENVTYNPKNKNKIINFYNKHKLFFYGISENHAVIHAKMYRFRNDEKTIFLGVGSPNFSYESNNNIESLILFSDKLICDEIWESFISSQKILNILFEENISDLIETESGLDYTLDDSILTDLWLHQQDIIKWLSQKKKAIINIPPGTGKTKIALSYLNHLFNNDSFLSGIVLVPTTALIKQWIKIIELGYDVFELKNDFNNLTGYFPNPNRKIIVTLYSRFFDLYEYYCNKIDLMRPNIFLIYDECHNAYYNMDKLELFKKRIEQNGCKLYLLALSATIDTFYVELLNKFINHMGGNKNHYEIGLTSFYSIWNNKNDHPILKPIKYTPLKYNLSNDEMKKYNDFSRKIAAQMNQNTLGNDTFSTSAIQRAFWLRGLEGGVELLKKYFFSHMNIFHNKSTIIFVQTNEIAQDIRELLVSQPSWNKATSIYIYDSKQSEQYREIALSEFKKNLGFCLISERMLSEGFDLPKIDSVILHGSYSSERDWIQKIGRAIRYNPSDPESIADVIDIIFCDGSGQPLPLEVERYNVLSSIGR